MHHGDISIEIAQGLLALQQRIKAAGIPPSQLDETLNIATWNIREFGKRAARRPSTTLPKSWGSSILSASSNSATISRTSAAC